MMRRYPPADGAHPTGYGEALHAGRSSPRFRPFEAAAAASKILGPADLAGSDSVTLCLVILT